MERPREARANPVERLIKRYRVATLVDLVDLFFHARV
jgi:hypothetical protein